MHLKIMINAYRRAACQRHLILLCMLLSGCFSGNSGTSGGAEVVADSSLETCPVRQHIDAVPGVRPQHLSLDYWLELEGGRHDLDAPLLLPGQVANLNAAVGTTPIRGEPLSTEERAELLRSVDERLTAMRERIAQGLYVEPTGEPLSSEQQALFAAVSAIPGLDPRLHIALETVPLRCGPRIQGLYKPEVDLAFDRNNCSSANAQEPVEVLAQWPNGMRLARTRYSLGWIEPQARLSPEVPPALRNAVVEGTRMRATRDLKLTAVGQTGGIEVSAGTLLAASSQGGGRVVFGDDRGVHQSLVLDAGAMATTARPITRRAVLNEAFSHLDEPYGWGGYQGARDCSRLLMDMFTGFGLNLPRFSGHQAQAGTFSIDISAVSSERERLLLLDAAAEKGVVFLYLPGHIMLYLGRDDQGEPMAVHSFAEFVSPCEGQAQTNNTAGETLFRIDKVTVSDLNIGRGGSRTAFIERLTRLVVIGAPPGAELQGVAVRRAPAPLAAPVESCAGSAEGISLVISPEHPHVGQPLRVIVTSAEDPGASAITLFDSQGRAFSPSLRRTGGPPYALIAQVDQPTDGDWTAVFGEGRDARACKRLRVHTQAQPRAPESTVWSPSRAWSEDMEILYAAFIESLFDYPLEEDITWPNLHSVLDDPQRNILYNHLSHHEETAIKLGPDCADLPYLLRSYFAWKMRLPFGFRRCNRGRAGRAPTCEPLQSNLMAASAADPVAAFNQFSQGTVRNAVHSGAGRTAPRDDETDYYPLPMSREAIRPGTLYADPYGHLLVVARWVPQGIDQYGILIAADAQPDGTIGLKRFWRGTFLFNPNMDVAGAGFKAFRPLIYDGGAMRALPNVALDASSGRLPYSEAQYAGSSDDFYVAMEGLINPRPLDPFAMQTWLIDAFEEAIQFRRVSVNNGINYTREHRGPVAMPVGTSIFQTVGPWEDYSTPSRDMRILIALDTVQGFPDLVRRQPQRFGLDPVVDDVGDQLQALERFLEQELASRTFEYMRSNGQSQRLALSDVVARREALEMAYNPNDCSEVRWAAPADSQEMSSCNRRAPEAQRRRMADYRQWFASRQRPLQ
jgi:hypothetical protein